MNRRLRVGVVFGGRSGEHEVSLRSASFVLESLDPELYEVVPIGITRAGEWLLSADPMSVLTDGGERAADGLSLPAALPIAEVRRRAGAHSIGRLDVVFPVLHGTYGEDGTVQGLFELAGLAYVGSGVAGSAVGLDKGITNGVLRDSGLPVADWIIVTRRDIQHGLDRVRRQVEGGFDYPVFVKPCNLGSSVGISKAHDSTELAAALRLAAEFDRRVIVEQAVPSAREIEVSVLGNDAPEASVCGEVIPGNEFYDYAAKYVDGTSREVIPADLPAELSERLREMAVRTFRAVDAAGYARVDFLVDGESLDPIVSEINTIPGFTSISMFPKLWRASGVGDRELMSRLIELALERHQERRSLRRSLT